MTDFERELEKAAEQYRDEDFKRNPNGYTVAPYVNEETTSTAFEAGARWALKSSVVKQMLQALKRIQAKVDIQANDDGLWSVPLYELQPVAEAMLQQELRSLHATIEKEMKILAEYNEAIKEHK